MKLFTRSNILQQQRQLHRWTFTIVSIAILTSANVPLTSNAVTPGPYDEVTNDHFDRFINNTNVSMEEDAKSPSSIMFTKQVESVQPLTTAVKSSSETNVSLSNNKSPSFKMRNRSTQRNMMSQQLTTLHGGNGSYGSIFTLEAHYPLKEESQNDKDGISNFPPTIEIASLSVVIETERDQITKVFLPAQITVLARLGSFENAEHKAKNWMIIHEASIEPSISDKGHFQLTEVGPFLKPIVILGGAAVTERQQLSLYVTSDTMSVVYTNVNQEVGEVFVTNEYFDTLVGVGVGVLAFTGGASDDSGNEEGHGNDNADGKTKEEMLLSSGIFPERMANVEIPYTIRPSPKLFSQPSASAAPLPSQLHQYNHPSSVETTLEGGNGSYGTMFTIKALQDVVITSLDIHTDKYVGVHVTVYTKLGKFDDAANIKQAMDWDVVSGNVTIMGQGFGSYTPIVFPQEYSNLGIDNVDDEKSNDVGFIPIFAHKDEVRSFYISLSTPDLRYTDSKATHNGEGNSTSGDEYHQPKVGDIYSVTPNEMEVHVGVGIGEKFFTYQEGPYQNRIFNGRINYQTIGPSYLPTIHPSDPPSTQPTEVIMIHGGGSVAVRTQQTITLEGIDPKTLLGEDQAALFETVAKRFLADLTKEKGVAITNVEVSPNDSNIGQQNDYNQRERSRLQKMSYRNKDNHYIIDIKNITSRDERNRGREHHGRQLQVDTVASEGGLEVFATVTGEYNPPPHINFENLVSDSFNDKGDDFLLDLKKEEKDRDNDGDDLFQSVRSMKAEPTEFLIDTTSSPTSSSGNSTVIAPSKGDELEISPSSSGMGKISSTKIILFSTICVLVTLILVISFLYYILVLHPNQRSRRKLEQEYNQEIMNNMYATSPNHDNKNNLDHSIMKEDVSYSSGYLTESSACSTEYDKRMSGLAYERRVSRELESQQHQQQKQYRQQDLDEKQAMLPKRLSLSGKKNSKTQHDQIQKGSIGSKIGVTPFDLLEVDPSTGVAASAMKSNEIMNTGF
mmetsp:Transcript_17762/g.20464  ORF Transcript_17762/g.20464 Transcript_17762/m.20464 type:complete len:1014 (-) Transcript_17762:73-3114(-)